MDQEKLLQEYNRLTKQLLIEYEKRKSFIHPKVLSISRKLDIILNLCQKSNFYLISTKVNCDESL